MSCIQRLSKEIVLLKNKPVNGVEFIPDEAEPLKWTLYVTAPSEYNTGSSNRPSPYASKTIKLTLNFLDTYPFVAPMVTFAPHSLWHPQVDFNSGVLCEADISSFWSSTKKVSDLAEYILNILAQPNVSSATNIEASNQLRNDILGFEKKVKDALKSSSV